MRQEPIVYVNGAPVCARPPNKIGEYAELGNVTRKFLYQLRWKYIYRMHKFKHIISIALSAEMHLTKYLRNKSMFKKVELSLKMIWVFTGSVFACESRFSFTLGTKLTIII